MLTETIHKIQSTPANQELRQLCCGAGEAGRQGDIYLRKFPESGTLSYSFPYESGAHRFTCDRKDATFKARTHQLAQGTTKGSRHVATAEAEVLDYPQKPSPLVGPVIRVRDPIRVEHPEHADFTIMPGDYQVTHQADYAADEIRAVRD